MKVEKIDHIVIRVRDSKKATRFFADLFETEFSELGEFKQLDIISYMDPLGIEIIEPLTPDGATARAIERGGEGLSLLSLKVPNLEEAIAEMNSQGIRQVWRGEHGNWRAVIYHPADTYGVMIELIEYKTKHPTVGS